MIRKIIEIDQEACNGCGACAKACHEGAIAMVDGKATLLRDDYCDGLGNCLPVCPVDAIRFVEREAAAYDEAAVEAAKTAKQTNVCPGSRMKTMERQAESVEAVAVPIRLMQWPVQMKLIPANAAFLDNADLLIAADCCAFAYGNFHQDFIAGRVTLIGCPKLDNTDYAVKLAEIFRTHEIRSVLVTRMQVPCCGGLAFAVEKAVLLSGKQIPVEVVTLSAEGKILSRK